ncbi:uncharacterized protein LOC118428901 [Branchiostoma floridae]|uniref:Uncharacterized protein LOC118428901 n=1 Tax=Branchiostoma floridae TaxID=7739 RepID=A0A9J7N8Y9_BRAFL|nr:uncharacterized protein LOC118428901 [Branchiostoma floridae]
MTTTPSTREVKRVSDLVDSQLRLSFDKLKEEFLGAVKQDILAAIKAEVRHELDQFKSSFQAEIDELKHTLVEKDEELTTLKVRLAEAESHADRNEQYSRKHCLLVFGIPPPPSPEERKSEDCASTFMDFTRKHLDVSVQRSDIDIAHRVGRPRDGAHTVIVKFTNYAKRQEVYKAKKRLKGKTNSTGKPYIIRENLTKRNLELCNSAKRLPSVSSAWTQDGKIFVKVNCEGGDPEIHRITGPTDIHQLELMANK